MCPSTCVEIEDGVPTDRVIVPILHMGVHREQLESLVTLREERLGVW